MATAIHLTREDHDLLASLLSTRRSTGRAAPFADLEGELGRAVVVPRAEVPADVVTMNSVVRLTDLDNGRRGEYALVYPGHADFRLGRISVLAPIGTALLGQRAGDVVAWVMPAGTKRFRIDAVVYQPEAHGVRPHQERPREGLAAAR